MLFIRKLIRNKIIRSAYLAWFSVALFFFYQYILRVSPGVMIDEIRSAFTITAEQFATLGSYYLIAYAVLQIPLGIIIDRVGVKKMAMHSIWLCIVGTLLFAATHTFWIAQLSRFIIGAGSASAFMCALKTIADHFPPGKRGFLMGMTLAMGTVGALVSGRSVKYIKEMTIWQDVLIITAGVGAGVFILVMLFVRTNKQDPLTLLNRKPIRDVIDNVIEICISKRIVLYAILAIGLYTPLSALADLWGTAFIKQKYGLDKAEAAQITMMMYIGLTIGSMLLPWLAEGRDRLNEAIIICMFGVAITFGIILYGPVYDEITLAGLLVLLGIFCGAEMMCFTGALQFSHKYDSGEIIGVVNTFNMLGGAILQQVIGWALDMQWDGNLDAEGIRQYSTEEFTYSLTALMAVIAFCCLVSFLLKNEKTKSAIAP